MVNTTNGVNREAAGICGLSYFLEDYSDTIWGDWYGGSPSYSGRGLGASIALFCLEKAMALEKKYICIMTEDMPLKTNANKFYDLVDIKVAKKEDLQHNGIHTATQLWRQKKIGGRWSTRFFLLSPIKFLQIYCKLTSDIGTKQGGGRTRYIGHSIAQFFKFS